MKKNNSQLLIVIPAIKKNAVIPDQLIKKLNNITLIQRAINIAKELVSDENIFIITDSEEIELICKRSNVKSYKDSSLRLDSDNIIQVVKNKIKTNKNILLFRANTPLIKVETLKKSYDYFLKNSDKILVSVKKVNKKVYEFQKKITFKKGTFFEELKAFYIFNNNSNEFEPYIIENEEAIEIETYQDWWVCEKLLQRKKIIFNVIGSIEIGMGHIFRSLSLAHEITNHEIIFVCNEKDELVVESIAAKDYKVISTNNILETIIKLKPDLVINDIFKLTRILYKKTKR